MTHLCHKNNKDSQHFLHVHVDANKVDSHESLAANMYPLNIELTPVVAYSFSEQMGFTDCELI